MARVWYLSFFGDDFYSIRLCVANWITPSVRQSSTLGNSRLQLIVGLMLIMIRGYRSSSTTFTKCPKELGVDVASVH